MKFINLTPHKIVIKTENKTLEVEPSGNARVATIEEVVGNVDGIPVVKRTFGEVEGLPEPEDGIAYIVSAMVLGAVKGRDDVFAPDTGKSAIRNERGQIEAVVRLIKAE